MSCDTQKNRMPNQLREAGRGRFPFFIVEPGRVCYNKARFVLAVAEDRKKSKAGYRVSGKLS